MKTVHKIFLAKLLYIFTKFVRSLFGKSDIATVIRDGVKWRLDLKEGIDFAIYICGKFEPQTVRACAKLIQPGDVVLDIGANIGAHTLNLAKAVGKQGTVIAFEPTDYAYKKLVANVSLNPELANRIIHEQIILGRENIKDYKTKIYSSWTLTEEVDRHPKHLGVLKTTDGASQYRLDSYLEEKNISRIDFIKMDVDGYECEVLSGAELTLKHNKPIICLELSPYVLQERGASIEQLIGILIDNNYKLFSESSGKELPLIGSRLRSLIGDGAGINAIAIAS
jgi:FkbM family methyltransferase